MWHETGASVSADKALNDGALLPSVSMTEYFLLSLTKLTFLSKSGVWSEIRGNRDTESCRIKYSLTYILSLQKQSRVESRRLRQVDACVGLDLGRCSETTEIATARDSGPFVFSPHIEKKIMQDWLSVSTAVRYWTADLKQPTNTFLKLKQSKTQSAPNSPDCIQKAFRVQNIFLCRSKEQWERLEGNNTAAAPSSNHTAVKQPSYWLNNQWGNVPTFYSKSTLLQVNKTKVDQLNILEGQQLLNMELVWSTSHTV